MLYQKYIPAYKSSETQIMIYRQLKLKCDEIELAIYEEASHKRSQ